MKLNDFRKLLKVKLNKCNIILITLLLFVVLTYTSIVPYITNLLKLEKQQELEEFRRKKGNTCVNGRPAKTFNYVMATHFGNDVKIKSRPQQNSYYTTQGLSPERAKTIINNYSTKARNKKYRNFSPKYMKRRFRTKKRQLLCNNYSQWTQDMNGEYSTKLPNTHQFIKGTDGKEYAFKKYKSVLKPCIWDSMLKKPRTRDRKRNAIRDLINNGDGGSKERLNRAFNICTDIYDIKSHPLNKKYNHMYSKKRMRKSQFDKLRYNSYSDVLFRSM
jgi:hypothetical protein